MMAKGKCIKCAYKRTKELLDQMELAEFKARMEIERLRIENSELTQMVHEDMHDAFTAKSNNFVK